MLKLNFRKKTMLELSTTAEKKPLVSGKENLPTMYDLPSENPNEPGLPDEFHHLQPTLLSETFVSPYYDKDRVFCGTNMNLYYDVENTRLYKQPDWFVAVGVPRLYDNCKLRYSYVVWQEGENPYVIVELLTPTTVTEDLGKYGASSIVEEEKRLRLNSAIHPGDGIRSNSPLSKWDVYEKKLSVPYYIVFSQKTKKLWFFKLENGQYKRQEIDENNPRLWMPELGLGLGLWAGKYRSINIVWLRWYDLNGNWIPTIQEWGQKEKEEKEKVIAISEQKRIEKERALALVSQKELQMEQAVINLLKTGMSIEQIATIMGLTVTQIETINQSSNAAN
jgi:Uma2 family endonuclease